MKVKSLLAVAVAGAFALPLAALASADGDRMILAQSGAPAGAASPMEASPRSAPSSDSPTSPSTGGTGRAK